MRQRIAHALRSMADRLDPLQPVSIPSRPQIRIPMPVFPPDFAARMGKQMRETMKTRPKLNIPILPSPPAPPAPRRLK